MPPPPPIAASINGRTLELVLGDITQVDVDAIVNAANSRLAGGGGVDGAIHRAGGPGIMEETRRRYPDGCPAGSAVITTAGNLKAKYVIHAVGPFWSGGDRDEERQLASAYEAALGLAAEHDCRSVAFPAISTGAYRYPLDAASRVAIRTVGKVLRELDSSHRLERVRFVLFSREILAAFESALRVESSVSFDSRLFICRSNLTRRLQAEIAYSAPVLGTGRRSLARPFTPAILIGYTRAVMQVGALKAQ